MQRSHSELSMLSVGIGESVSVHICGHCDSCVWTVAARKPLAMRSCVLKIVQLCMVHAQPSVRVAGGGRGGYGSRCCRDML